MFAFHFFSLPPTVCVCVRYKSCCCYPISHVPFSAVFLSLSLSLSLCLCENIAIPASFDKNNKISAATRATIYRFHFSVLTLRHLKNESFTVILSRKSQVGVAITKSQLCWIRFLFFFTFAMFFRQGAHHEFKRLYLNVTFHNVPHKKHQLI